MQRMQAKKKELVQFVGIQCIRVSTSANQLCSRKNPRDNARCGNGFHWARGGEVQRVAPRAIRVCRIQRLKSFGVIHTLFVDKS